MQIIEAFPTPIVTHLWPNSESLNSELCQLINKLAQESQSQQNSNVGGFHSNTQFIHTQAGPVIQIKNRILQLAQVMGEYYGLSKDAALDANLAGWANLMTNGNYHRLHSHPDCHWSGVYYVSTGKLIPDAKPNGNLQFQDPRSGANRLIVRGLEMVPAVTIAPTPGLMVMFPSYLEHYVHPFFGEGSRISIAFNLRITKVNSRQG